MYQQIAYIHITKRWGALQKEKRKKRIVILGGGFAGVECTRELEKQFGDNPDIELVMINRDNCLLFTPMLPQAASGMLETRHIVMPIRVVCKKTIFYEGAIKGIYPQTKTVTLWGDTEDRTKGLSIKYDYLVIALGSETNFFGMSDVRYNALTMKTLNDAILLRNRAIDMLEFAENQKDATLRKKSLRFVVAGAGFAGIETAGELMDLLRDAKKHYPSIPTKEIEVIVLEALPSILPGFNQKLAEFAKKKMEGRGIEFRLQTAVTSFDGNQIKVKQLDKETTEHTIDAKTMVWTAGVSTTNTIKRSIFKTQKGRIVVDNNLEVPEFPGVFAIGDCVWFVDYTTKKPLPPTAQIAISQAKTVAKNLGALIKGTKKEEFVFRSRGQMATIGKRTGIASIFGMNVSGLWAWIIWRNVYLSKIPMWDKKIRVLLDWIIDFFFGRDTSRLNPTRRYGAKEYKTIDELDDF